MRSATRSLCVDGGLIMKSMYDSAVHTVPETCPTSLFSGAGSGAGDDAVVGNVSAPDSEVLRYENEVALERREGS